MIKIQMDANRPGDPVLIPQGFFREVMPGLDELSLKCYLYLYSRAGQADALFPEEELLDLFHMSSQDLADTLQCLEKQGLIRLTQDGLVMIHWQDLLQTRSQVAEYPVTDRLTQEKETVIQQINNTFYQGLMPPVFFNLIDHWFRDYQFTPELVYALFNELRRYETLQSENYAERVAANWASRKIRTFEELNAFVEDRQEFQQAANLVRKKLRQNGPLTVYQTEYLKRWLEEWQLPFDLVDEALRRASLSKGQVNFNYVEGILKNWHQAGLHDLAEVEAYEAKYHKPQTPRSGRRTSGSVGNFEQRHYDNNQFRDLYRSLDFLQEEAGVEDGDR